MSYSSPAGFREPISRFFIRTDTVPGTGDYEYRFHETDARYVPCPGYRLMFEYFLQGLADSLFSRISSDMFMYLRVSEGMIMPST